MNTLNIVTIVLAIIAIGISSFSIYKVLSVCKVCKPGSQGSQGAQGPKGPKGAPGVCQNCVKTDGKTPYKFTSSGGAYSGYPLTWSSTQMSNNSGFNPIGLEHTGTSPQSFTVNQG